MSNFLPTAASESVSISYRDDDYNVIVEEFATEAEAYARADHVAEISTLPAWQFNVVFI